LHSTNAYRFFLIFFWVVNKKKTGLETYSLKKTKHSSRRLKIAERNYCLMTVPSTAEMELAWCSLHTTNSRNPNDGRGAVNPTQSMNKHWKHTL
jgi:hypothetical protein